MTDHYTLRASPSLTTHPRSDTRDQLPSATGPTHSSCPTQTRSLPTTQAYQLAVAGHTRRECRSCCSLGKHCSQYRTVRNAVAIAIPQQSPLCRTRRGCCSSCSPAMFQGPDHTRQNAVRIAVWKLHSECHIYPHAIAIAVPRMCHPKCRTVRDAAAVAVGLALIRDPVTIAVLGRTARNIASVRDATQEAATSKCRSQYRASRRLHWRCSRVRSFHPV